MRREKFFKEQITDMLLLLTGAWKVIGFCSFSLLPRNSLRNTDDDHEHITHSSHVGSFSADGFGLKTV